MSPALLTKYLQAARDVADHMFLNPNGFEFAPHPMLVETDREKYCIQQIVDFYDRQTDRLRRLLPRGVDLQASRRASASPARRSPTSPRRHKVSAQVPDDDLAGAGRRRKTSGRWQSCRRCGARCRCRRAISPTSLRDGSMRDARLRRPDAQGHGAEVRQPDREGTERRIAAADELEEPAVRHAPPRFRARRAAGRGRAAAGRGRRCRDAKPRARRRRARTAKT